MTRSTGTGDSISPHSPDILHPASWPYSRILNKKTCPELSSGAGFIFHRSSIAMVLHLAKEARANNVALLANRGVRISHWTRRNRLDRGASFRWGLGGASLSPFFLLFAVAAVAAAAAAINPQLLQPQHCSQQQPQPQPQLWQRNIPQSRSSRQQQWLAAAANCSYCSSTQLCSQQQLFSQPQLCSQQQLFSQQQLGSQQLLQQQLLRWNMPQRLSHRPPSSSGGSSSYCSS